MIDLELEELTLSELLEVETALVSFMLSVLLLRCCHIIVEVSELSLVYIYCVFPSWPGFQACAWFLEITSSRKSACIYVVDMCVFVCHMWICVCLCVI